MLVGGKMKKVYICSALTSRGEKWRNLAEAQNYCRQALMRGYLPIAPHVMYGNSLADDDPKEREIALAAGIELLKVCDEIWIFGSVTGGMVNEVQVAKELDLTIRFICKDGSDWVWPKA